jgi:predicted dehydrogenase
MALASEQYMEIFNMKTIKVAVVGLGKMGLLHASILNTMPNVEIMALCDKSSILRKLVKRLFKSAQVVDDVEKLAGLDLSSVYVTTPIPSHFPIVKNLLTNQMATSIFVEKTLTSSWEKSKELCELARTVAGVNMVGYMKRFSVTFLKVKKMLTENILGDLISFDAYAYSSDFSNVQPGSKKSTLRGGVLSDLGSHVIDLALWYFNDFEVRSAFSKSIVDQEGEDSVDFEVKKFDLEGTIHASWCMDNYRMPNFGLKITGHDGTLKVNDYTVELNLRNGAPQKWFKHDLDDHVKFLLGDSEYYREDESYINSILNSGKADPSFLDASRVDQIIDLVRKEAKKIVA